MNRKDLTGETFGEWTVIRYIGNGLWECKCSCGTIKNILTGKLTSGQTKSCGHNKLVDLTGKTFGEWTVLSYEGNMMWKCKCSCGEIRSISSRHLRNGVSTNCGHLGNPKRVKLEGTTVGEYEVLKYLGNKYYQCRCSCGRLKVIHASRLINKTVDSCGHTSRLTDLTGQRFGKLTVNEYVSNRFYKCTCDCGNTVEVMTCNLLNGSTKSCGCIRDTVYTKEYITCKLNEITLELGSEPSKKEFADFLDISIEYLYKLLHDYDIPNSWFDNTFGSNLEKQVYEYIKSIDKCTEIILHDRSQIEDLELDIYIPSKSLAIEINGSYWCSSVFKYREYHRDKTLACKAKGIRLIHIFDYEWKDDNTRVKIQSILRNILQDRPKTIIYARNCSIKQVETECEQEFLNINHLQGFIPSAIALGLYDSTGDLISIMTFGKPRFNNSYEYEIIRYCTKHDIRVVGGAEKLFNHFINEQRAQSVISYCDISKFSGDVYTTHLGMQFDHYSTPNYCWIKRNFKSLNDVISRYNTQLNKLIEYGLGEHGNSEDEIMQNLGYYKVYDCGNAVYCWVNT